MATSVARVEEFFVAHCGEIVQLSKQTLRDVVMSNQAHKHKVWMQAQNFYMRQVHLVTAEQQELLDDWEFLLCDMSTLRPVAFLPRMQRCLDRSQAFLHQNAEMVKQLHGTTLQGVLRGRHLKDNCMAVFTSVLLDRYLDNFSEEQAELVLQWEVELCEKSAEVLAKAAASRGRAFLGVLQFFARHAYKIVQLCKQTMREVVTANMANMHAEWKHTQNFYMRHWPLLNVDQKDLLHDYEFVLCDMTRLDAMAFSHRMNRCFERSFCFLQESGEAIKQLGADSLQGVLHSRELKHEPMSVFMIVFLERYAEHLTEAQRDGISMWEAEFCRTSAEARERARRTCARTFLRTQEFLANFADAIVQLRKMNLREVVESNQAHKHAEWMQARNFLRRAVPLLTREERDLLEDWEFVLCDMDSLRNSVAFVSLRDRCFKHVESLVLQRRDAIQKIGAKTVQLALLSRHMLQWPMSTFARVFLQRYMDDLDAQQISVVSGWEEKLCSLSAAAREAASKSRAEALVEVEVFCEACE